MHLGRRLTEMVLEAMPSCEVASAMVPSRGIGAYINQISVVVVGTSECTRTGSYGCQGRCT
jgi:hypothetical protein